jgi:hypothetical protein
MGNTSELIKLAIAKTNSDITDFTFRAMPEKEVAVFIAALKNIPNILIKMDHDYLKFNKEEIKKWAVIYLHLHNLFHSEANDEDLTKLEIVTTAPIFIEVPEIITQEEQKKLNLAYFSLGVAALKINHNLENLISEKIILGEFMAFGGLQEGIWGWQLKDEILTSVAKNILEKTNKNNHYFLVKKYKNFIFDFL